MTPVVLVGVAEKGKISGAAYKQRSRTDEQTKLFPQLQVEIEERRTRLEALVRDQISVKHEAEICSAKFAIGIGTLYSLPNSVARAISL